MSLPRSTPTVSTTNLRVLMERRRLTPDRLAELAGLPPILIRWRLKVPGVLRPRELEAIAWVLKVSPAELLDGRG